MDKKIALITWGSRGLWKNMALKLAEQWKDIIITYNSKKQEADKVVIEIQKLWSKAIALKLDVWDINTYDSFFDEVRIWLKEFFWVDKIDFLINNAGIWIYEPFATTSEEQFDLLVNIHFKAAFFLTQKALVLLNDWWWIINISSWLTRFSQPWSSAYASMKWAIETLSKYQAKELWNRWIRVNVVAPGAIETDFGWWRVRDNPEINKMISSMTALGRAGISDDIWWVVAFLCSKDAKWINWQRIEISGWVNL